MPQSKDDRVDIGKKLRAMIDSGAIDAAELARACGVTRQAVYGWLKTGRVAKERLPVFEKLSGKSLSWWLSPDDPADVTAVTSNQLSESYNPVASPITTLKSVVVRPITTYESLDELPPESTVLLTRIDVQLSAGNGKESWHIEERDPLPFQADYIRRLDAKPKNLVAVKVTGDSMEPRLFDDDTVVVDRADLRIPASGGVFALVYAGEMLVKRLFRLPDGSLRIVSDNKEKHEPFLVAPDKLEHITIVGRVKYRSGMGDF
ncbi:hypothetical protein H3V53_13930 [Paraburkholderia bengalensis]|uniref:Peptidase S24/S26A/S26B/S26C domain-containing protein n=1 Tax=Paraburkholderia bengalensis TaxID=2747562 RepID=A0ABU8IS12_9BURK